jgi:hypothetical protein
MKNESCVYQVKRLDSRRDEWWKDAEEAKLNCFPWGGYPEDDYRPATAAGIGTDGTSLFVHMATDEDNLRIETRGFGHVHTDSCMEFFFSPDPASPLYLNFEFNPSGAMWLAIGTERHGRTALPVENYTEVFQVKTRIQAGWDLEFSVPLSFLRPHFPAVEFNPGRLMRGNFYKCGEETSRPHPGCWAPIDLPKPDFHCPEFFGLIKL